MPIFSLSAWPVSAMYEMVAQHVDQEEVQGRQVYWRTTLGKKEDQHFAGKVKPYWHSEPFYKALSLDRCTAAFT